MVQIAEFNKIIALAGDFISDQEKMILYNYCAQKEMNPVRLGNFYQCTRYPLYKKDKVLWGTTLEQEEKRFFKGRLVWTPDGLRCDLLNQFLESALKKGVYSSAPTLAFPVRKDQNGQDIKFNFIANEEELVKLFAANEGNLEASLKLLDENILNYRHNRD